MNISANSSVANPNFGAKIKRNEAFNKFTEKMGENQRKDFNKLLCKLGTISKGDVLEIYEKKEPEKSSHGNDYSTFFIHNPKKKHSDIELDSGYRYRSNSVVPDKLVKVIEKVLEPKTKETKTLLTEPARNGKSIFQRLSDFFSIDDGDDPTAYRY